MLCEKYYVSVRFMMFECIFMLGDEGRIIIFDLKIAEVGVYFFAEGMYL